MSTTSFVRLTFDNDNSLDFVLGKEAKKRVDTAVRTLRTTVSQLSKEALLFYDWAFRIHQARYSLGFENDGKYDWVGFSPRAPLGQYLERRGLEGVMEGETTTDNWSGRLRFSTQGYQQFLKLKDTLRITSDGPVMAEAWGLYLRLIEGYTSPPPTNLVVEKPPGIVIMEFPGTFLWQYVERLRTGEPETLAT